MTEEKQPQNNPNPKLERDTYQILKTRLETQGTELRERLDKLNNARKDTFGSVETKLISNERITTKNNCLSRDMVPVGNWFLFGYNVVMGLKTEMKVSDVFSIYTFENHSFHPQALAAIDDDRFKEDFANLYKYYKHTQFAKFAKIGPFLHMVFRVGQGTDDIKTFKWQIKGDELAYVDNRSDHEFSYPDQHQFQWKRVNRDMHRNGVHPHISIEDRLFVETIGGDLTIKIEDNTETGEGIYAEPVEYSDQGLDDAEIHYAILQSIIVLKIKPYQESKFRYIVFNEKIHEAVRIDALEDACVLLPDDHGIIFPKGYYLQTGESKVFEYDMANMHFERKVISPNGEDYLYSFYNKPNGLYVLLSYNLIDQVVETPILCNGFAIFENGEMLYFKGDNEQKKHHLVQIWQTPYYHPDYETPSENTDTAIYKIGNKDVVRGMAECHEILTLLNKEDSYNDLYVDLVKKTTEIIDSYYWLKEADTFNLFEPLESIRGTATSALDEFEKVKRIRSNTEEQVAHVEGQLNQIKSDVLKSKSDTVDHYVHFLAEYRKLRGEIISLKELRYVDVEKVEGFEEFVQKRAEELSEACVGFLLKDDALKPYEQKVQETEAAIGNIAKVVEANELEENIDAFSRELEMLIEIVGNLKIEDATQTTRIIDNISKIYSDFNRIKTLLKRKRKDLLSVEGKAEFHAQINLLEQGLINYLDIAKTPERCEEYLTKMMVQVEELESRFSEFSEFVSVLTEKREEIYTAFENRKVALVEERNRRANALSESADRILKSISSRLEGFGTVAEINGYMAGDLMVDKVRNLIEDLVKLDDSVKADDLQSRLKTAKEDALRQLKDKTELYSNSGDVIKFGKHQFSVNTQTLDLTTVLRKGEMYFHLTGTNFFERVSDPEFLETKEFWNQHYLSESDEVYRAEFLAYQLFNQAVQNPDIDLAVWQTLPKEELLAIVQKEMNKRFSEGYTKGVHDEDATLILQSVSGMHEISGLLKYTSSSRAFAALFWNGFLEKDQKTAWQKRLKGAGIILQVFPTTQEFKGVISQLGSQLQAFYDSASLFEEVDVNEAAEYLFYELAAHDDFVIDADAASAYHSFNEYITSEKHKLRFDQTIKALADDHLSRFQLIRQWVYAFLETTNQEQHFDILDEVSQVIFSNGFHANRVVSVPLHQTLDGFRGEHALVDEGKYELKYNEFLQRLRLFDAVKVPEFKGFQLQKKELVQTFRDEVRLNEFKPRVLSSFVRNRLINEVYLPIIGDNLAKQIGTTGENKRTDRMGMLLLISPPGYGKTTLMEYIASRLGIIFMKINGPAIGHQVTSIDPQEANNAAARQELEKLNLALEMGDNVMLYLDDIQHCNPEFLQKFISLCDATRKIEGVYKGKTKTYDLRGKKVCVVMAGNPYTESGEKFQIPDMLANRADIYNLGDVIGETEEAFKLSYLENSLTSNATLAKLASKSQKDVYSLIKIAQTGSQEGIDFEANHGAEEVNEYVNVLKKLLVIRDIVFDVNQHYIESAAQSNEYRTEPPFKLQGSYRNMNKLAEKVVPIMNEKELDTLILSHYENESQTLTSHAEGNLLKFKEVFEKLGEEENARWESIKATFQKNNRLKGFGQNNQIAQLMMQMGSIIEGLTGIEDALNQDKYFLKVKNISKVKDKGKDE